MSQLEYDVAMGFGFLFLILGALRMWKSPEGREFFKDVKDFLRGYFKKESK